MNYTKSEIDLIVVDSISHLYYQHKKLLLATVNPNTKDGQKYETELIKSVGEGVYNKVKALLSDEEYREGVLADLKRRGIECSTFKSADYPERLKHTPYPPLVLYLRGRRELLSSRTFAVVGSRRTPANILEETKRLCAELSNYVTVVTGVADGGDSAAISGALSTGNVICVLPGGHDSNCCNNVNLYKRVQREGLTLTEYAPTVPVQRHTFAMRNRIIAGLSEGVLVVSAGEKSGARSTANYALEYDREVLAFPYGIGASAGKGCNKMIKEGAALCEGIQDIFAVLGIENKTQTAEIYEEAEGDEAAVLNLLKTEGEMHAEKIAAALKLKLTDVVTACSMLEIKGLITRTVGNSYAII